MNDSIVLCSVDDLSEVRLKELWSTRSKPKVVEQPAVEPMREDGEEIILTTDEPETQEVTDEVDFDTEPFVMAVVAFKEKKFHGILELLTEAITNGRQCHYVFVL